MKPRSLKIIAFCLPGFDKKKLSNAQAHSPETKTCIKCVCAIEVACSIQFRFFFFFFIFQFNGFNECQLCVFATWNAKIFIVCICTMGKLTGKQEGCLKHDRHYMFVYATIHCAPLFACISNIHDEKILL